MYNAKRTTCCIFIYAGLNLPFQGSHQNNATSQVFSVSALLTFRVVARMAWGIVGYLLAFPASRHYFQLFLQLQQQKISPNVTKHPQRERETNSALAKVCYSKVPATLTYPSRLANASVIWKPSPLMAKSSKGSKKQLWLPWWYRMSDIYWSINVKFKFSKRRGFSYNECYKTPDTKAQTLDTERHRQSP